MCHEIFYLFTFYVFCGNKKEILPLHIWISSPMEIIWLVGQNVNIVHRRRNVFHCITISTCSRKKMIDAPLKLMLKLGGWKHVRRLSYETPSSAGVGCQTEKQRCHTHSMGWCIWTPPCWFISKLCIAVSCFDLEKEKGKKNTNSFRLK